MISSFEENSAVNSVRWAPTGVEIAHGSDVQRLSMYRNLCVPYEEIVLLVESLQTCFDELSTSTQQLQSQIDELAQ